MLKYCATTRWGRGGEVFLKAAPILVLFLIIFIAPDVNSHEIESGSDNFENQSLKLDSVQDILNVTNTVNEVVGEVVNNLTPTDLFNTGTNLPFNLPLNPLNHTDGLDLEKFFTPAGVSSGDLTGILKGVAVLSIQIFIVVVQIATEVFKGVYQAF